LGRPLLVIVPGTERAQEYYEQLQAWTPYPEHVLLFPAQAHLPYQRVASDRQILSQRLRALSRLYVDHDTSLAPIVVTSARALVHRTLPPWDFEAEVRVLKQGDWIAMRDLLHTLYRLGYGPTAMVDQPGEFSHRGGIVDVFPPADDRPLRVEFFGDEIESLRRFDLDTQRSEEIVHQAVVTPAHEALPLRGPSVARELQAVDLSTLHPLAQGEFQRYLKNLGEGNVFPAIGLFQPLLHPEAATVLDYFPPEGRIIVDDWGQVDIVADQLAGQAETQRAEQEAAHEIPRGFEASPYASWTDLRRRLVARRPLVLGHAHTEPFDGARDKHSRSDDRAPVAGTTTLRQPFPSTGLRRSDMAQDTGSAAARLAACFKPSPRYGGQLQEVVADTVEMMADGDSIVAVTRQAPRLAELYEDWGVYITPLQVVNAPPKPGSITLVHGQLSEGWTMVRSGGESGKRRPFGRSVTSATLSTGLSHVEGLRTGSELIEGSITVLSDGEIFGWRMPKRSRQVRRHKHASEAFFADVAVGDYVVHIEHGIAVYRGLVKLDVGESEREYLVLEYDKGDKLYVPTYQVDRVARYVGVGGLPPRITRLGTADWERVKQKAKKAIEDIAQELLELYAEREVAKGHAFGPDTSWQAALEAAFPHVETEDQLQAIEDIKRDMESERPMDRLLVGDVGFGKTEVAVRAAFKALMDGKQVAVLVPTTVLAQQHFNTFQERLRPFPIVVEMLSRFRSASEQDKILKRLQGGEIDVIIGTHRLIQKDVAFKDLGLLIVDEEHRFGVKAKERLKKLRTMIDVLSMTATPIPRTLHMSLTGVRDMSTIDTPPDERLPITTQVTEWDDELIRRAILRELSRGGQVFFVHNRVATIEYMAERLRRLVPEAYFAIAHGQMHEDQLATTMLAFAAGDIDVLVCTSIIESGLDIQNANTLIVDGAHMFGLAQLYQLRGRVGRGAQRAYAYFLYNEHRDLPEDARKRLQTLMEATDLGAGFRIAMRDLEIRGAGDLLGSRQHGHISAVGFDLYTRLLAQAIKESKADRSPDDDQASSREPALSPSASLRTGLSKGSARGAVPDRGAAVDADSAGLPTINLPIDAYLPESYVSEDHIRLRLYRRMSQVSSMDDVLAMQRELKDRFGDLPVEAQNLMFLLRLKVLAARAGAQYVTREGKTIVIKLAGAGPQQRAAILRRFDGRLRVGRDQVWMPLVTRAGQWRRDLERALEDLAESVNSNQ
ncbi:MAG: transcription-repair coupling factor, partial [Anaerolineae bacterium]